MKKLTILSILFISLAFLTPMQASAAWWNPVSWFSKSQPAEEREQSPSDNSNSAASEPQTANQNVEATEKLNTVAPVANPQPSDVKTIESLKVEIATLKTNLDNLYKAHNSLVNDHNTLLKSTTDLEKRFSTLQNQPATNNVSSDILYRVSELERKEKFISDEIYGDSGLNIKVTRLQSLSGLERLESKLGDVCGWVFGLQYKGCPFDPNPTNSINDRLKKLERAY